MQLWTIPIPPEYNKSKREFERIQKKICRHKMSIMFNEICINYIFVYNMEIYISDSMLRSINDKLEKVLVKRCLFFPYMFRYIT